MQDNELIKRIRQGEQALFGELADKYYDDIYRYCYYQTGDEHAAWDCSQETFCHLMRFLDNYTERGKFKAYLLRIALNVCRDYFRQNGRDDVPYADLSDTASAPFGAGAAPKQNSQSGAEKISSLCQPSPENQAVNAVLIQGALNALPEFQREAAVLFYYYGYKQREIARITGVPLSTVKTRLRAGTEKLKERLQRDGLWQYRSF